jgi:hypothetical protein
VLVCSPGVIVIEPSEVKDPETPWVGHHIEVLRVWFLDPIAPLRALCCLALLGTSRLAPVHAQVHSQ